MLNKFYYSLLPYINPITLTIWIMNIEAKINSHININTITQSLLLFTIKILYCYSHIAISNSDCTLNWKITCFHGLLSNDEYIVVYLSIVFQSIVRFFAIWKKTALSVITRSKQLSLSHRVSRRSLLWSFFISFLAFIVLYKFQIDSPLYAATTGCYLTFIELAREYTRAQMMIIPFLPVSLPLPALLSPVLSQCSWRKQTGV